MLHFRSTFCPFCALPELLAHMTREGLKLPFVGFDTVHENCKATAAHGCMRVGGIDLSEMEGWWWRGHLTARLTTESEKNRGNAGSTSHDPGLAVRILRRWPAPTAPAAPTPPLILNVRGRVGVRRLPTRCSSRSGRGSHSPWGRSHCGMVPTAAPSSTRRATATPAPWRRPVGAATRCGGRRGSDARPRRGPRGYGA
jgi:hypothetical protein